jgi:hypothetical protein
MESDLNLHNYTHLFFRALAATVTIETIVLAIYFFLRRWRGLSRGLVIRILVAGVIASCVTLPLVWFIFPAIIENRTFFLVVAELFAFFAEVPIIRGIVKTSWPEATAASFFANGISVLSGFLLGMS